MCSNYALWTKNGSRDMVSFQQIPICKLRLYITQVRDLEPLGPLVCLKMSQIHLCFHENQRSQEIAELTFCFSGSGRHPDLSNQEVGAV